jgi:hypothetical protein
MELKLDEFEFYRVDFLYEEHNLRTGEVMPVVKKINWFKVVGLTKNFSLVVIDIKGKKQWVKQEFYNSSSSPYWKKNHRYGILVRAKTEEIDEIKKIAIFFKLNEKSPEQAN